MFDVPFTDQLQTTDDQFLDELNLPGQAGKALAAARAALACGDRAKINAAVAGYFRNRTSPAWSYYSHGTPWHETDAPGSVIEKADGLLKNRFRNSWPPHQWIDLGTSGDDPDWNQGLRRIPTSIMRGTYVTELSTAFALTGNSDYARKALQLMRSYVTALPFVLDPRFFEDHDAYFGGPGNHTQTLPYLMFRWVDFLHSGAMHAPGVFGDEDIVWLVKQLWFWSMQFFRLSTDPMRRDNHHLIDHGHEPYALGMMFPEFAHGPAMAKWGAETIRFHFSHNLLADGAYHEHSAEYQYHITYHFLHPAGVAKANSHKLLTARQVDQLREWVKFSAYAAKPNGMLPSIGDSPGRPLHHLFGSLATPVMSPELDHMARGLGIAPGKHLVASMADAAKAMTGWRAGMRVPFGVSAYYDRKPVLATPKAAPKPATKQYPLGGYTFFRSDWTRDADYLSVSHFNSDYGGHAHWDMMAVNLHTRGRTLIGDPAAWLYLDSRFHGHGSATVEPKPDQLKHHRGYSYSVNAHNCLVMNDDMLKPLEAMSHGTFWGGYPPRHGTGIFQAGGPIEVAEIWHDANAPTRHRKFVVHVRGIGFIIVDLISRRPNLSPHQYSQYYHLEGDVQLAPQQPQSAQAMRVFDGNAACLIVPGRETESRWRTFRDEYLDNLYGVPSKHGLPWVIELTRRIRGQAVFTHFLLTGDAAGAQSAEARYLGQEPAKYFDWQYEGLSAHALPLGPAGTLLVASCPYDAKLATPKMSTDAELAVVHLSPTGRPKSWIMARGSTLTVGKKTLVKAKKTEWKSS